MVNSIIKRKFERDIYVVGWCGTNSPIVKCGMAEDVESRTTDAYGNKLMLYAFEPIKNGKRYTDSDFYHWLDDAARGVLYRPERTGHGRERFDVIDPTLLKMYERSSSEERDDKHSEFWASVTCMMKAYENEWKYDVKNRSLTYAMRQEQAECVEQATSWFNNDGHTFLIAAKMRFGKTHVSYQIALAIGAKKVIVLSFAPQAKSSWKDDLLGHVAFSKYIYHDYKDGIPKFTGRDVCFASMQSLTTGNVGERSWVFDTQWDLIIFDEEHIGTSTLKSGDIINKLHSKHQLWVSGTAFRDIALVKFSPDNTFTWTYVDEQNAKANEFASLRPKFDVSATSYQALPQMNMRAIKPGKKHAEVLAELLDGVTDVDLMPNLAKVFAVNDGGTSFVHSSQVRAVLMMLELELSQGNFGDPRSLNHLFVYVSSVLAAKLLVEIMQHDTFFSSYFLVNATGDNEVDVNVVKRRVLGERKTLTLTVRRWCEAVTVPEWGTVVLLDEIKSPAQFWQTIFRAQGPCIDANRSYHKQECYVIAFSLDLLLSQVYQLAYFTRKQGQTLEQSFKQILASIPIYGSCTTQLTPVKFADAFARGLQVAEDVQGMFNGSSAVATVNLDAELLISLNNVIPIDDIVASVEQALHSSGLDKGKTSSRDKPNTKNDHDPIIDENNRLLKVLRSLERLLPRFMYASSTRARTLNELLMSTGTKWDAKFERYVGINRETFKQLVTKGAFHVQSLDDKIAAFSTKEDALNLEETFDAS